MTRLAGLLFVAHLAACVGTSSAPSADVGAPDAGALSMPDLPGRCFEVFRTVAPPEAAPDRLSGIPGSSFRFPRIVVGQRVVASVRFWNSCNASEHDARVLAVEAGGADGGALDPSFTIGGPAIPGYVVRVWATTQEPSYTITLQPRAPGEYSARVIVRFPQGFDEAVVTATAVAP
jgi:hypothetical protein